MAGRMTPEERVEEILTALAGYGEAELLAALALIVKQTRAPARTARQTVPVRSLPRPIGPPTTMSVIEFV